MEREGMAAVLRAPNHLCNVVCFFALFATNFVHNDIATVSYELKELLDNRTAITHLELDKDFFFNESDAKDILLCRDKAQIPVISVKKRQRKRVRRVGCLVRIRQRVGKPPLPSVLLANVQSLENKLDDL
jgi:hypothetical protein